MKLWLIEWSGFENKATMFSAFHLFSLILGVCLIGFIVAVFDSVRFLSDFLLGVGLVSSTVSFVCLMSWLVALMFYFCKWNSKWVRTCFNELEAIE